MAGLNAHPQSHEDHVERPVDRRQVLSRPARRGALAPVNGPLRRVSASDDALPAVVAETRLHGDAVVEPSAADEAEVRPLRQLRPVPPALRRVPSTRVDGASRVPVDFPAYDPFTARRRRAPEWLLAHISTVVAGDILAVLAAVLLAWAVPLTNSHPDRSLAVAVTFLWPALLATLGSYAERRQGTGVDEYRRVIDAGLIASAGLGVLAAVAPGEGLGRLVLLGIPPATVLTLLGRGFNRSRLHSARRRGLMTKRVVVIGRDAAAEDLVRRVRRDPTAGLDVVGACVPRRGATGRLAAMGVPVLGDLDDAVRVIDESRADAVLVATASETAGQYLRNLAWRLEGTNIEVLVGPGMIEVAPSRLHVRPTTSVALIRIQEPEFRGARRLTKSVVDRVAAFVLLLAVAPLFLVLACAIKLTSRGPVIYRHRRIGKGGREFDLLKFRSMVVDADRQKDVLMAFNEGNAVQFKLRCDPRVTGVGQFIRRFSLDELPQLINVLKGEMSLVGPRPHVTREVEQYGPDMRRRLFVKPGITGLWQVSGRSNLAWDESVELDVRYVENWSLALDLSILWRTVGAVLRSAGAY
jgi:exopolysaccharide biosynthesis polyprenyl glycosylphosphotransferase